MNDPIEATVTRALDRYAEALRGIQPSTHLDTRLETAIHKWTAVRSVRRSWRRPLPWAIAAASVAVLVGGLALLRARPGAERDDVAVVATPIEQLARVTGGGETRAALATGQLSLWPTEAAVFRVRASLGASAAALHPGGITGERHFWVDVRIANDGSMRIVRVVPVNGDDAFVP